MIDFLHNFAFLPQNQKMTAQKYLHTKHIEAIAAGDNEFMTELIDIFLAQIPEFISKMNSSLKEQDWKELAREAHTAKSSVLTFGMDETGTLLKSIQLKAEANDLAELPTMIKEATQQLEAVTPELHEFKDSLKK